MDFPEFLKRTANDIIDIICPEVCLGGCGKRLARDGERLICQNCLSEITHSVNFDSDNYQISDFFLGHDIKIEYGNWLFKFTKNDGNEESRHSATQDLIHNIKYFGHPELGVRIGKIAGLKMKKYQRFLDIDYIIPVPMHPAKQKKRGFNQAEKISEGISEVLGKEIRTDILKKTMNTGSQTKMNKEQRMENSSKIFASAFSDTEDTSHYLIVDDVYTTGSTLLMCATKLKESHPNCKISIFALAKA